MDYPTDEATVAPAAAGIATLAASWASAAGTRVKLISELALAEAKLAAISLALMAFLAMLAAAFVLSAWGLLVAGLVHALVQMQIPLWPVLLVLGGLHALIAALAWRGAVRLSHNLEFAYTRKQLGQEMEDGDEMAATT
jgi:uncharacterized membrane protein YqjE